MLFRTVQTDANGQLTVCPHCDNEEMVQGGYCIICGIDLTAAEQSGGKDCEHAISIHQGQ